MIAENNCGRIIRRRQSSNAGCLRRWHGGIASTDLNIEHPEQRSIIRRKYMALTKERDDDAFSIRVI